jgi:hypothetical protein
MKNSEESENEKKQTFVDSGLTDISKGSRFNLKSGAIEANSQSEGEQEVKNQNASHQVESNHVPNKKALNSFILGGRRITVSRNK